MKVQIITASTANFTLVKKGLNYRRWYLNYQNVHWKEALQYLTNKDKKQKHKSLNQTSYYCTYSLQIK